MLESVNFKLKELAAKKSATQILSWGLIFRLSVMLYGIFHDNKISHIKYTDIDYRVFTNASQALADNRSPYQDREYRYPPIVAFIFLPNIFINEHFGKLALVLVDTLCGHMIYTLNIQQGTHRLNSKLYLILWLFNPLTVAISTRGSFEPFVILTLLTSLCSLVNGNYVSSGFFYGLCIHLKLYPVIYALTIYFYITQRKPYLKTSTKISYWIRTLAPSCNHFKFFISASLSLILSSYVSYRYYGYDYIYQSFIYHLERKDLQHNFSIYFYVYRLFPKKQELISSIAFAPQLLGVLYVSLQHISFDSNRRTKLRKLTFSLFCSTFLFVSLNKVCTSQYFNWYLVFVPLIMDSIKLETHQTMSIAASWFLSQVNWLLFAYLYEYHKLDIIDYVGNSSILFLMSNLWILKTLCFYFEPHK